MVALCALASWLRLCDAEVFACYVALLQDFELAFFPRSVRVKTPHVGCEHPPASPIDDSNRQRQGSAGSPPISQPACSYQRKVVLRLYVCDTSTSA